MNRYTLVLPSENQNAFSLVLHLGKCRLYCNTVTLERASRRSDFLQRYTRNFEIRSRVLRVKK